MTLRHCWRSRVGVGVVLVGVVLSACATAGQRPTDNACAAALHVENEAYYDYVVYVDGRRLGMAGGLRTTTLCLRRTTNQAQLTFRVRQIAGSAYVVQYPIAWTGEDVLLVIATTPGRSWSRPHSGR